MTPSSRTRAFSTLSALLASAAITFTLAPGTAIAQQQVARLIKDTNRDLSPQSVQIGWVAPVANGVVFLHGNRQAQPDLWTSKGDAKTTLSLESSKDWSTSTPFPFGTGAGAKVAINRTASNLPIGLDITVTDGTAAGTFTVYQPATGLQTEVLAGTTTGFFFDRRAAGANGTEELFFSDGTVAGTRSLNPLAGGPRKFTFPEFAFTDGALFYFVANRNEIWRSDGTDAGTVKLATAPVPNLSPIKVQKAGSQMFIHVTANPSGEYSLWSCPLDGDTPTRIFPSVAQGAQTIDQSIALGNDLVFTTHDSIQSFKLWRTDGTVAGTREIPIPTGASYEAYDGEFTIWHGSVYFLPELTSIDAGATPTFKEVLFRLDSGSDSLTQLGTFGIGATLIPATPWREREPSLYFYNVNPDTSATEFWQTNGDVKTTKLSKLPANHYLRTTAPSEAADTSLGIFFAGSGLPKNEVEGLFRAKGKKASTRLTSVPTWTANGIVSFEEPPTLAPSAPLYEKVGSSLVVFVNIGDTFELWTMNPDGTKAKSIWRPLQGLQNDTTPLIRGTINEGNRAIFTCVDSFGNTQVWSTDGTKKGTVLVNNHQDLPHDFAIIGNTCYYSVLHTGLFKTDGTPAGSSTVSELDMQPSNMTVFQGKVWFTATAPNDRIALWSSDGTAAGTVVVKDAWLDGESIEEPGGLAVVNGKLIFWVRYFGAQQLWQSDGTTVGTVSVTLPAYFRDTGCDPVANLNGVAIFPARLTPESYSQLWAYDATNGLRALQANPPAYDSSYLYPWAFAHAVAGNQLFFTNGTTKGPTLWVTDGTVAGTQELVKPGSGNIPQPYAPHEMLAVGNVVYFAARSSSVGIELWSSDGTVAGTNVISDVQGGIEHSSPAGLKAIVDKLYFNADRRDVGRELFRIDLPPQ